jgi:hydroxymethylbilane synthase
MKSLIIGTRGSALALYQAHFIQNALKAHSPSLKIIRTHGDQDQTRPFQEMQTKGIFTKELEEALLRKEIDIAVHSLKDLLTESPPGLILGAIPLRASAHDVLLMRKSALDPERTRPWLLQEGKVLGTSAARRASLVQYYRPDLQIKTLRGNVPTRVEKLQQGDYDAILLAQAGLERLKIDLSFCEVQYLHPQFFPPAPGQGAIAVQMRAEDQDLFPLVNALQDPLSAELVEAERRFLAYFEGGCSVPIGAYAKREGEGFSLSAYIELQGKKILDYDRGNSSSEVADRLYQKITQQLSLQ